MPAEPRWVTSMDLVRARNVVSSLAPLKQLGADDAESVAKAIAQCFAKGRELGWHLARAEFEPPGLWHA